MPLVVERSSDSSQGLAALTHTLDLIRHGPLTGVCLDVLPVSAQAVAELGRPGRAALALYTLSDHERETAQQQAMFDKLMQMRQGPKQ